jgi:hypothetical protein
MAPLYVAPFVLAKRKGCDYMAGNGRPQKYAEYVEPYLDDIKKMSLSMTEKQIAETLEISYSTFRKYKEQYPALKDALKIGRRQLVVKLHSALIRRAEGYDYEETKTVKRDGKVVETQTTKKHVPPDVAAINLALKNFDRDNWANDPQALELHKRELKLKERQIKNNDW